MMRRQNHRSFLHFRVRGVTMIELVMATAIIGITYMMTRMSINLITGFSKQTNVIQTDRDANVALYLISRDLRNAESILWISSTTLQLRIFDTRAGYNAATNPFYDLARAGTRTWRYTDAAEAGHVRVTTEYPDRTTETKLLANFVLAPSEEKPLFAVYPAGVPPNEATAVDIWFRLQSASHEDHVLEYKAAAGTRTWD